VSLIDVLHHVPPAGQRELLAQAASRVQPGGVLIYKDLCDRPWWRTSANRLHDLLTAWQWIHYLPLEQAETWLTDAGLVRRARKDFSRYWYGHELLVFARPH
jgi:2-polyprenyl-3-methyl-5-hydroxy-6-metoxy-1,4-benzoquinol methylase